MANTADAAAITHRLCGTMVAPAIAIGSSPVNAGRAWIFLSHTSAPRPRSRIEAPMVMMMSVTTDAPRAGSAANLRGARPHRPRRAPLPRRPAGRHQGTTPRLGAGFVLDRVVGN